MVGHFKLAPKLTRMKMKKRPLALKADEIMTARQKLDKQRMTKLPY